MGAPDQRQRSQEGKGDGVSKPAKMRTYHFALHVPGRKVMTDRMANKIFAAGCDDSTPGSSNGKVSVHFDRQAATRKLAISSAIADLQKAGYRAVVDKDPWGKQAGKAKTKIFFHLSEKGWENLRTLQQLTGKPSLEDTLESLIRVWANGKKQKPTP